MKRLSTLQILLFTASCFALAAIAVTIITFSGLLFYGVVNGYAYSQTIAIFCCLLALAYNLNDQEGKLNNRIKNKYRP